MKKRQRKKWLKKQEAYRDRIACYTWDSIVVEMGPAGEALRAGQAVYRAEDGTLRAAIEVVFPLQEFWRDLSSHQPGLIGYEYPTGTPVFAEPRHNDHIPDDMALPLDEWNAKVDALLAECAARAQEQA